MASVDLEKAYYSISIHKESRKYLRFMLDGSTFEYSSLPFGLSSAPYIFTRLMKVVFANLRCSGFSSMFYLDDCLLISPTMEDCYQYISATTSLSQKCGFTISWEKSYLMPNKKLDFWASI